MLVCALSAIFAHETAGAASTGIPCSLCFEGNEFQQPRALRAENAKMCQMLNTVIASEAKQSSLSLCRDVDCFASLAMIWIGRGVLDTRLRGV
jgi:hypothetical protein